MTARPGRIGRWAGRRWFDVVVVVVLSVTAYRMRRDGLPTDGLWFDDSWVAAGVTEGSLSNLLTVGSGHPGFTLVLMAWNSVTGGHILALAYPALLAGTIGPAALYVALRSFGYTRSVCTVLGAALVVSDVHALYSGRVKGYALDPLWILALAVLVPRLARATWRWPTAVAWAVGAVAVGSFSGFALVGTAAAGVILLLHPASDRVVRGVAVAAQGSLQLALLLAARRSVDLAEIEATQEGFYDGHLTFSVNPFRFGDEALEHLSRVAMVYPGGSGRWLTVLVLAALIGLVAAAFVVWDRDESVRARYLLLIISLAFVGGVLGQFPFGTRQSGGRHTLWLVPVVAVGIAAIAERVRRRLTPRLLKPGVDLLALGLAGAVMMAGYEEPLVYPSSGSTAATEFVEAELRDGDVVLVTQTSIYAYTIASKSPRTLRATPDRMIGFTPAFENPRIHTIGAFGEEIGRPPVIRLMVRDAERVFVHVGLDLGRVVRNTETALTAEGFVLADRRWFGSVFVAVWER